MFKNIGFVLFCLVVLGIVASVTVRPEKNLKPAVVSQELYRPDVCFEEEPEDTCSGEKLTIHNPRNKKIEVDLYCGADHSDSKVYVAAKSDLVVFVELYVKTNGKSCIILDWKDL